MLLPLPALRQRVKRIHPTQKPVELLEWCLGKVPGVKSLVDPFAGSSATLEAAMKLGLEAWGIERERDYCQAGAERLQALHRRLTAG